MTTAFDINGTAVTFLLVLLLTAAVVTDLRTHRIPNLLLATALAVAVLLQTLSTGLDGLIAATGGFLVGLAMLLPFYAIGGMGAGDVKLLAVVGSFLGPWGALIVGLATMMCGGLLGIAVILWQRFSPYLQPFANQWIGLHGSMFTAPQMSRTANDGKRITKIIYSPAIAAGTAAALWYIGI